MDKGQLKIDNERAQSGRCLTQKRLPDSAHAIAETVFNSLHPISTSGGTPKYAKDANEPAQKEAPDNRSPGQRKGRMPRSNQPHGFPFLRKLSLIFPVPLFITFAIVALGWFGPELF